MIRAEHDIYWLRGHFHGRISTKEVIRLQNKAHVFHRYTIRIMERHRHDLARENREPRSLAIAHTVGYAETAVLSRAYIRRERHAAPANR
jgi:hypothetical protein